ncbi:MAG: DUF1552 domain-containing protein [Planctomycetia bacterium]|nr:DUF1552 domain-containing protein [Planctomycetia bacterium]
MTANPRIPRRTLLKGLGAAVALPMLDAMLPVRARAEAAALATLPRRLAFIYVPNGIHMPDWTPERAGSDFDLPPILAHLEAHRNDITVFSGLAQDKARPNGDGPGDHARALASFLTGCQAYKTNGAHIRAGVSVDQVAAQQIGHRTRFPSLELGVDRGAQSGNCDSGYSCAYSSNISWRTPTTPLPKEINPRALFERLFGGGTGPQTAEARGQRLKYRKSILDFVREDAAGLKNKLGATDQRKMDEYLTAVREVEERIARAELASAGEPPDIERPTGIPKKHQKHLQLMSDLLILAFQADLTRVATFMFANAGSNRSYSFIDVPEGHHDLSHHGGNEEKQAKISKINQFHAKNLAHILDRMRAIREGDGTMLDQAMIAYGSGIGDGNAHNHDKLPILVAGRGGGTIQTGRHVQFDKEMPLNNLWLSLLDRIDAHADHLGDSTGRVEL